MSQRVRRKGYWMLVTGDIYELPLAVAESAAELARMTGVKAASISTMVSRSEAKGIKSRYIFVEKEEDK